MTQTTTDLQVSVYSGLMDSGAYQIAHDLLAGYSDDYFFFQGDSYEYYLVLNYDTAEYITTGYYTFGECDYYLIQVSSNSSTQSVAFDGNSTGRFFYGQGAGSYAGTYTGSIPLPVASPPTYKVSYYHDSDGCSVFNSSGYVCYGTFDYLPSLIEGECFYEYAQTALFCVCGFFVLASGIFKHVRKC